MRLRLLCVQTGLPDFQRAGRDDGDFAEAQKLRAYEKDVELPQCRLGHSS